MSDTDQYQRELDVIESVADKSGPAKFFAYARISGPGWLQGAITLGGGSLAGALFLGVVCGYGLLWVQPLAMICGIIMLCAIAYVTLSTGQRPLRAINEHLHPLLGWSWVVATIMANVVWVMPQFSLATGAIQQNLFSPDVSKWLIIPVLFVIGLFVNYLYEAGGSSAKLFDLIIKIMVGVIVLSFFAVVITLAFNGKLPWGKIFTGYLPNLSLLFNPSSSYDTLIAQSSNPEWWDAKIASKQKDIIFAGFGAAVGINMTFLLPYTLLKKKWGSKHRGLSITDLSIGLFIPFFLATSCVVIAAASSFHTKTGDLEPGAGSDTLLTLPAIEKSLSDFQGDNKEAFQKTALASLPESDRQLAAMLVKRDAKSLAITLEPFTGNVIAQKIFGIGVLGMAVSTIIILMLINGLAFQELFAGKKAQSTEDTAAALSNKAPYFLGCTISGLAGFAFPFLWTGKSLAALAVPTSVIGGSLIPIAYFTFFLMMNSKKVLGDKRPEGSARILWNALMIFATCIATLGSVWAIKDKAFGDIPAGKIGIGFLILLFIVGTISFIRNEKKA